MNRVVDPRQAHRARRSPGPPVSKVSVLRWPSSDSSRGVFEMFSAREAGSFGSHEGKGADPAHGENVLLVSASRRADPDQPAVLLSFVNTSPRQAVRLSLKLAGPTPKSVAGTVLTAPPPGLHTPAARRGSAAPKPVGPAPFHGAVLNGKVVGITVPARSLVVLTVEQRGHPAPVT